MSLKEKTIQGLVWSFISNFSVQIITLLTGIVLARLLSPREFGLIGMLTIFIALSNVLVNSGIIDALIRDPKIKDEDYSTAFIFNIVLSVLLYSILFLAAPWISEFYTEPQLKPMVRLLSLSLVINAFVLVHRTRQVKAINFKLLTKIDVIAAVSSGIIAIGLASNGFGVWSLVSKTILSSLFTVSLFWLWVKWKPSLVFNVASFKRMFSFGSKLAILGIIDTLFLNMNYLIIGKVYSASQLGFYTQAEKFKNFPSKGITGIVQQVTYPVFAEIQDNTETLRSSYQKLVKIVSTITITLLFGLAAVSENLVKFILGPEWSTTGEYLVILSFIAIFYPLMALNQNIMKVKGRSTLILNLGILKKINTIPVILAAIFISIKAMLLLMIVQHFLAFCINAYFGGKLINYRFWDQLRDILPPIFVSGLMYLIIVVMNAYLFLATVPLLIVQIFTGAIISFLLYELFKIEGYIDLKNEIKRQFIKS